MRKGLFVAEIAYLGPFNDNGICWTNHIQRMGSKIGKAAYFCRNLGYHGGGIDTASCLRIFHCFLKPILEYGLTLCPLNQKHLAQNHFRLVSSGGNCSSVLNLE
jgi:hypothetical protein